jgi:hypothetical protein
VQQQGSGGVCVCGTIKAYFSKHHTYSSMQPPSIAAAAIAEQCAYSQPRDSCRSAAPDSPPLAGSSSLSNCRNHL